MITSRLRRPISASTTKVRCPFSASAAPRLAVVVVLPTPPFPEVTTITSAPFFFPEAQVKERLIVGTDPIFNPTEIELCEDACFTKKEGFVKVILAHPVLSKRLNRRKIKAKGYLLWSQGNTHRSAFCNPCFEYLPFRALLFCTLPTDNSTYGVCHSPLGI